MQAIVRLFTAIPGRTHSQSLVGRQVWPWLFGMLSIVLVTAIWGYSNVVMRQSESAMSPGMMLWLRFGIAGVVMSPLLLRVRLSRRYWLLGLGTGALLGLSVLAQAFAMMTIPVDEVAFITALYVVFTPVGVSILSRRRPSWLVWVAVVLSLSGVSLLIGKVTLHMHIGVLWAIAAAVGLSGQIIGTTSLTRKVSSAELASLQSVGAGAALTVAVVCQGFFEPSVYHGLLRWNTSEWLSIAYLVLLATVIAVFLQSWGQARITANEAALAFNMEPVWTAVFAWWILEQGMTAMQMVGAVLIIGSLTLVSKPKNST